MSREIPQKNNSMRMVEYQGQRVITFSMVDEVHQRPKGTAKVTFSRNRSRFIEGEDFFIVAASMVNWGRTGNLARGIKHTGKNLNSAVSVRGRVTLITESGYLLLTKPFNDDLAWQVQRQLIKTYFRHAPQFPELQKINVPSTAELATMSLENALHLLTKADRESFTLHGQKGSAALRLRREELKELRPVMGLIAERSQIELPGMKND